VTHRTFLQRCYIRIGGNRPAAIDVGQLRATRSEHQQKQSSQELHELAGIYRKRGLTPELALRVAEELSAHDALGAHARDELGITEAQRARPVQAAIASAASFSAGSLLPLLAVWTAPVTYLRSATIAVTMVSLLLTGALAAYTGGAPVVRGALRLFGWGALAMLATELVGRLFHTSVS
jgi:VIT1/CCC1 family predicted Fe2+/Mn2+ transporter